MLKIEPQYLIFRTREGGGLNWLYYTLQYNLVSVQPECVLDDIVHVPTRISINPCYKKL